MVAQAVKQKWKCEIEKQTYKLIASAPGKLDLSMTGDRFPPAEIIPGLIDFEYGPTTKQTVALVACLWRSFVLNWPLALKGARQKRPKSLD